MATISKTWWGNIFIKALEEFMEEGRLARGRSYRTSNRILKYEIIDNTIKATVRGNKNPYFGVYKEPKYKTSITIKKIVKKEWSNIIKNISENINWISKLMLNEMPNTITKAFGKHHLLPKTKSELITKCSCPDHYNPCKHIAGVYYKTALMLDFNPFLLFQLRGLPFDELQDELKKTSIGKILLTKLKNIEPSYTLNNKFFTEINTDPFPKEVNFKNFWMGSQVCDFKEQQFENNNISAVLVKKGGDYPAFWDKEGSFLNAMESIYIYARKKLNEYL